MSDKKPGLASVSDAFKKMEDEWIDRIPVEMTQKV